MTNERRVCGFDNCERLSTTKGFCNTHYAQKLRTGRQWPITKGTHQWGGWTNDGHGYIRRWRTLPDGTREGQMQHRFIKEQELGRALLDTEDVHHINGVRTDNRPENLELWVRSHPRGQRVEDQVNWAVFLLKTYAPEMLSITPAS